MTGNHPHIICPPVLSGGPRIFYVMGSWAGCRAEMISGDENELPDMDPH